MRLLRAWLPALVAALLWLASAWLEWLSRGTTSRVLQVLDLLSPETVPLAQLTAPAPWGLLAAGAWALAVAGAYAALLALVRLRRGEAPRPTTLAAYWMCAVAAGAGVAAVPVVAVVVRALVQLEAPMGLGNVYLVAAAHWGLVWGWLPALVALALDGSGPRSRWALVVSGLLVFAAGAGGMVVAAPAADAARLAAIPPEPAPEPVPTGTPVPEVAPGEWQLDPLWCTSGQLEFRAGAVDAALGTRAMPVYATNASTAPCVLESYPDVAFSDPLTAALDVVVDHGGTMASEDPGVTRIELAPGEQAVAVLWWRAPAASSTEPAGWVHVAANHGARREMVQVDTDITGGTVAVTAWSRAD